MIEAVNAKYAEMQIKGELSAILIHLAQETEDLAIKERQSFSPILKKWRPAAASVAALMLHSCYGHVLRQYLTDVTSLTSEAVEVLQRAEKLEKVFVQMVVEDSHEDDDNGKTVVKDMVPYEVDSVILNLLRKWIDESLYTGRECFQRAKETEVSFSFIILLSFKDYGYVWIDLIESAYVWFHGWNNFDKIQYDKHFFYYRHGIQSLNQSYMHNQQQS